VVAELADVALAVGDAGDVAEFVIGPVGDYVLSRSSALDGALGALAVRVLDELGDALLGGADGFGLAAEAAGAVVHIGAAHAALVGVLQQVAVGARVGFGG